MAEDNRQRPSLEVPKLFGRRRAQTADDDGPGAEAVFEDSGTDAPAPAAGRRIRRGRDEEPAAERTVVLDEPDEETPDPGEDSTTRTRRRRLPTRVLGVPLLPGRLAAVVTGVVVGLALVALVWLGFRGCELVRGTSSCGTAPGMVALLVILVAAIAVGGVLFRFFEVPDPGSTSFLATGLTGVVCLLFLVEVLDHWSMVLVIPAVSALTHLAAWWVTTRYVEPA